MTTPESNNTLEFSPLESFVENSVMDEKQQTNGDCMSGYSAVPTEGLDGETFKDLEVGAKPEDDSKMQKDAGFHNSGGEAEGTTRNDAKNQCQPLEVVSTSNDGGGQGSPGPIVRVMENEPMGLVLGRAGVLFLVLFPVFACFMLAFTEIGFGATVFKYLASGSFGSNVAGLGLLLLLLLYLFDASYWTGPIMGTLRNVLFSIAGLCMLVALILTFRTRPYAPVLGFFVAVTLFCCLVYWKFYIRTHIVNYMYSLSIALGVGGAIGLAISL
eukprot:CAMPEP_0181329054 /NCGR_PEP_ID=MMETSP1101-20121128/23092_1 /TAXON_ID=46948 /ORGANISM="Rhodomonas abbreviata, Strain Caron Lab Isolate" /LENGTH=270 /DNA_ID=CAMNT_0023438079 /DNA_START=169 /DNA_END=977 /DNA_ORIENTATION=+